MKHPPHVQLTPMTPTHRFIADTARDTLAFFVVALFIGAVAIALAASHMGASV